jgi:hypothetical protein
MGQELTVRASTRSNGGEGGRVRVFAVAEDGLVVKVTVRSSQIPNEVYQPGDQGYP